MFFKEIDGKPRPINYLVVRDLPNIIKVHPFVFNAKKHYFFDYIKIKEVEDQLEVTPWKYLNQQQKCMANLILGSLIATYSIRLIGVNITFSVHPSLEKDYSGMYTEKIIFGKGVNSSIFAPDKKFTHIAMSCEKCREITRIHSNKHLDTISNKIVVKIPMEWVSSLIII